MTSEFPDEQDETESTSADPMIQGIRQTREILDALPPLDDDDRAYWGAIQAFLTGIELLAGDVEEPEEEKG
jgi:hypothetical protein